jgi:hypothetical protein
VIRRRSWNLGLVRVLLGYSLAVLVVGVVLALASA